VDAYQGRIRTLGNRLESHGGETGLGQPGVGIGHRHTDAHAARPADLVQRSGDPMAHPVVGEPVERRHPTPVVEPVDDAGRVSVFRPFLCLARCDGAQARHRWWLLAHAAGVDRGAGCAVRGLYVLVYTMEKGFMVPFGALYLLSLGLAFGVTIRMRETVEAVV
jgi:hypothetical protein